MQTIAPRARRFSQFLHTLLVLALCLPLLTSCESRKTIVNGIDEKEANEIWVFLSNKGIDVSKVQAADVGGAGGGKKIILYDIQVPSEQAADAIALLNQAGLPRRRGERLLGLFTDVGLVPSEMTEKIKYQAGLGEQIASVIRKIDGVLDSEVQVSFPEEDPLNISREKKRPITASVYVKHSGVLDDPNTQLITKIKRLVASSVTGLDFDNVTVIGDRARFTEYAVGGSIYGDEEKPFVTIWTLVLAKESLSRFRIIFFSFLLILLLLLLSFVWVIWKVFPLLQKHGGFKGLLSVHPLVGMKEKQTEEEEEETEEGDEAKEEEVGEPEIEDEEEEEEEEEGPKGVT